MNRAHLRRILPVLLAASLAPLLPAAETKAADPAKSVPPPAPLETVGPVIDLPIIQVSPSRIKAIDKSIVRLDKQIARERKQIASSELDRTINNAKVASAAAIFGGNSTEHLAAISASRIMLMEQERLILEGMKHPRNEAELKLMEVELEQLRTNRRNLDNINVPH